MPVQKKKTKLLKDFKFHTFIVLFFSSDIVAVKGLKRVVTAGGLDSVKIASSKCSVKILSYPKVTLSDCKMYCGFHTLNHVAVRFILGITHDFPECEKKRGGGGGGYKIYLYKFKK